MRLLFLDWPHLALRLALGHDPGPEEAVVLGGRPWDPGSVVDHSPAAGALGVRRGQPLGVAHSLVPEAAFLPFDGPTLRGPLESALDALSGLAPAVEGEGDPAAPAFGRILVGIEGLARLWGDEATLVRTARDLVAAAIPWPARAGIGNTRFGAEVAARTGRAAIPLGGWAEEAAFLAPLPLPNVPALRDNTVSATLSVRERLTEHRANPACASCHRLIDPPGFSLENYDAVGRWRTVEEGKSIDASGGLPDGGEFTGVSGLERGLLNRPEVFVGTLTEKLLTFALGRPVETTDAPAVRQIVRQAKADDFRFSSIILGIASSTPFIMRTSL
jgi:hypothetical protein